RIAVLVNGIPQNDPEDHNVYWINFPDLAASAENVQVQRGAGLSTYGAAAIGGSINLTTLNIARAPIARITMGAGFQEFGAGRNAVPSDIAPQALSKLSFEYGSGLLPGSFAFYTRLSHIQSRGYRDNSWATLQSYFVSAGRFTEDLSIQVNVFGGPIADGLAYTGLPKSYISDPALRRTNYNFWMYDSSGANLSYAATRRPQEREGFSQPHAELHVNATLSSALTLRSTLFYYTGEGYFDYDASWADARTLRLSAEFGGSDTVKAPGNAIIRASVANRQVGWIPTLSYAHEGGNLTVGAEVRMHHSERYGRIQYAENLPQGFDPDFRIYAVNGRRSVTSLFLREEYSLGSDLVFNAEVQGVSSVYALSNERAGRISTRYTTTDGRVVGNGGDLFAVPYFFVNPRAGITWNIDDHQRMFASVAHTTREPRMANLYASEESYYSGAGPLFATDTTGGVTRYDFSAPLIKPESMLDAELGWRFAHEGTSAEITAYWMDFRDELVKNGRRDIFGNPMVGNAPRTLHRGLELQASTPLVQTASYRLLGGFHATLSDNRIKQYGYQGSVGVLDLKDNPIAGFPSSLAQAYVTLHSGGFFARLNVVHVGRMYADNFGDNLKRYRALAPGDIPYADNVVEASTVLNLLVRYELKDVMGFPSVRLSAQCNNLANTLYAAAANGAEFFPAAERNWFFGVELGM
ncbi:MAG: TonB-dependent receptor, partial [Candidatus Kapaibacterium sp.]